MSDINKDLCKRFDLLCSERTTVERLWDAITDFVTPYRGEFFENNSSEQSIDWYRDRDSFDGTATNAHQNLSANLHGSITSPSIKWFLMRFRSKRLNKVKEVKEWIQGAADSVFFALQDSNFNLEVNETYQDLAGFGTAFISLEESDGPKNEFNGLEFNSIPLKQSYYEPDYRGRVLRFYRILEWTADQIISKFGDDVPDIIKTAAKNPTRQKFEVLWVVHPRNNKTVRLGDKVAPSRRPWEARYILRSTKETLGKPIGYYEQIVFCVKWRLTSESDWGNSPAAYAMADILSLNELVEMDLIAKEKAIDPPTMANERALLSDLDLGAGKLSVVADVTGIKQLPSMNNIQASELAINRLQDAVRNYFFQDQLTFPAQQAQPMTATEAQIRYELLQRLLGPTMGRIQSDMLDPIIGRAMRMLARDGEIPPPPQEVIDANAELDIEYMGPLVRAQFADNAAAIERWIMGLASIAEIFPEVLDVVDAVEMAIQMGEDLHIPAILMRSKAQIEEKQRRNQEARKQAEQNALAQQAGEASQAVAQGEQAMQEVNNNVPA